MAASFLAFSLNHPVSLSHTHTYTHNESVMVTAAFYEETVAISSLECTVELLAEPFSHMLSLKPAKGTQTAGFEHLLEFKLLVYSILTGTIIIKG